MAVPKTVGVMEGPHPVPRHKWRHRILDEFLHLKPLSAEAVAQSEHLHLEPLVEGGVVIVVRPGWTADRKAGYDDI